MLTPLLLLVPVLAGTTNRCHICGNKGNTGLKHPLGYLESVGKTCALHALNVFSNPLADCPSEQTRAVKCCDGSNLPPAPAPPPKEIPDIVKTGNQPICHLCRDGSLPTDPHHVINMLYIGAGTCEQYWKAGREGIIPAHLCDPLKFFAKDPCGCKPAKPPHSQTRGRFEFKPYHHQYILETLKYVGTAAIGLLAGIAVAIIIQMIM